MYLKNKAFTLIEVMVGVLIVSIVIISGFEAFSKIGIGKINLIEKTNMQKDSFYFSEKLFQIIKEGGTIDYEEYFNRKMLGVTYGSGHYNIPSGFGNFGRLGFVGTSTYGNTHYYCRSSDTTSMGSLGCENGFNDSNGSPDLDSYNYTGVSQRIGQYSYQFIDYNSNFDSDLGDENGDGKIVGDDDDEFLGDGPISFPSGIDVKELYLISGDKKTRTFIRWSVNADPDKPGSGTGSICSIDSSNVITGDGCRGTVEFLKLEGVDWGLDHRVSTLDLSQNDGLIDTRLIDKQFTGLSNVDETTSIIAGTNIINYWKPIFPTGINVTDFKVFPYPNLNSKYFWKNPNPSTNISPYVIINLKIKPSWEVRKKLKNSGREINFNSTINLTDIYSK